VVPAAPPNGLAPKRLNGVVDLGPSRSRVRLTSCQARRSARRCGRARVHHRSAPGPPPAGIGAAGGRARRHHRLHGAQWRGDDVPGADRGHGGGELPGRLRHPGPAEGQPDRTRGRTRPDPGKWSGGTREPFWNARPLARGRRDHTKCSLRFPVRASRTICRGLPGAMPADPPRPFHLVSHRPSQSPFGMLGRALARRSGERSKMALEARMGNRMERFECSRSGGRANERSNGVRPARRRSEGWKFSQAARDRRTRPSRVGLAFPRGSGTGALDIPPTRVRADPGASSRRKMAGPRPPGGRVRTGQRSGSPSRSAPRERRSYGPWSPGRRSSR